MIDDSSLFKNIFATKKEAAASRNSGKKAVQT